MTTDSYESKFFNLKLKEGILYVTYIGGPITLEIVKDLVEHRLEMTSHKDVPVLVNTLNVNGIEREARNFLSSDAGVKGLKAGAIVTDSAFTKHMANFFMRISFNNFNKSKMPARVFSGEREAVEWLKQYT